jgi:hypothetical protein
MSTTARRPWNATTARRQTDVDDLATTTAVDVSAVGAMDVSVKTERSGVETNVIARSDDRATTNGMRRQSLRKESSSFAQGTPILCAKDSNPLRRGLESLAQRIIIRCARIRKVVAAGDYVHAAIASIAIADKIHAGYKSQFLKRDSAKRRHRRLGGLTGILCLLCFYLSQ